MALLKKKEKKIIENKSIPPAEGSIPDLKQLLEIEKAKTPIAPPQPDTLRKTIQGDTFDIAKGIARSEFKDEASYQQAKNIKSVGGKGGLTIQGQNVTPEYLKSISPETKAIEQIGNLTPEQIAEINQLPEMQRQGVLKQIAENALKQGAIGAVGGATAGLATGGALSAPLAIAGGAVGLISGGVTGAFRAYQTSASLNVGSVEQNVGIAKSNMNEAIRLANRGGDAMTAVQEFNRAYTQLLKAQQQYKVLEEKQGYEWVTKIKDKQVAIQEELQNVEISRQLLQIAIQKPNPAYAMQQNAQQ